MRDNLQHWMICQKQDVSYIKFLGEEIRGKGDWGTCYDATSHGALENLIDRSHLAASSFSVPFFYFFGTFKTRSSVTQADL